MVVAGGLAWAGVVSWLGFILWRKLRVDYDEERIFTLSAWLVSIMTVAGVGGEMVLFRQWGVYLPVSLIAGVAGAVYICQKRKWDVWEWLDTLVPMYMGLGLIVALLFERWWMVGVSWVVGGLVGWWSSKMYRRIRWYPSGKMGFTAMNSLIWWSIAETAVANFAVGRLYWGELTVEHLILVGIILVSSVALYLRSGRKGISLWPKTKLKKTNR